MPGLEEIAMASFKGKGPRPTRLEGDHFPDRGEALDLPVTFAPLTLSLPLHEPAESIERLPVPADCPPARNILEEYRVTDRFLCRVPVAKDVQYCPCGGVLSQRLNESLFCRRCGRDGSL